MTSTQILTSDELNGASEEKLSTLKYARSFGVVFVLVAIVFGAVSFLVLLGLTPIAPTPQTVLIMMGINAFFVALLILLVGREIASLIGARRRGRAAARMHIRIVGLFGVVAAFPAIVVAIVAGITLDLGLDRIFDARTRQIVDSSISVAESYVQETADTLNSHTINMGFLLQRNRSGYFLDRQGFINYMTGQARGRGLLGSSIIDGSGRVLMTATLPNNADLPAAPDSLRELAKDGKPACGGPRVRNLAGCILKLSELGDDVYLYTLRTVDSSVVNSLQLMEEITAEYRTLESGRLPLQIAFALLYFGICLTILLSAIWMGIGVADRLVAPIRRLITAADAVREGDLTVSVPTTRSEGDLRSLTDTFNAMTGELRTQRNEILDNQEQIDGRRRFTEAVLSGVTAGVIGVSPAGRIAIANRSAESLFDGPDLPLVGSKLADTHPELAKVVNDAEKSEKHEYRDQITITRHGRDRTLNVQVTADSTVEQTHSHVVTIDDITDLVSAQRTSAWADVARRIAHEIKNPLTPIQLSAERIKRRYGKVITEDREVFDQCTETIVRQVADIGRMVDEFSSFARMPKPTLSVGDLSESIKEAVFLLKVGHSEIEFSTELGIEPIIAKFDARLMSQAFGNLIKNATEAIESKTYEEGDKPYIRIQSSVVEQFHCIDIIDNGKGLPSENRQRLLEPYMTTREKGTGLGLAIVGKILEEHGGTVELMDAPQVREGGEGAMIRVRLPINEDNNDNLFEGDPESGRREVVDGV